MRKELRATAAILLVSGGLLMMSGCTLRRHAPAGSPSIQITYPTRGTFLNHTKTIVTGRLVSRSEAAVTVNGWPAMVSGDRFAVNDLPLPLGLSLITAALTTADGVLQKDSVTVGVDRAERSVVEITAARREGLAPFSPQFEVEGDLSAPVEEVSVQRIGPSPALNPATMRWDVLPVRDSLHLTAPGLYVFEASVRTKDGATYRDRIAFHVLEAVVLEALLLERWERIWGALLEGKIDRALEYFAPASRDKYRRVLTELQSSRKVIHTSIEAIHLLSVRDGVAEAEVVRTEEGTTYSYPIYFVRGIDGTWQLESL